MTDDFETSRTGPHLKHLSLPWRNLPGALPGSTEIFTIGDVHGQADLLEVALTSIAQTPRTALVRHMVFLGDLIDRGPKSIASIHLAVNGLTLAAADHLHILPGNHDLMLLDALEADDALEHWLMNGGKNVLAEADLCWRENSWSEITSHLQKQIPPAYFEQIAHGPSYLVLGDLIFVHAGIHPHRDRAAFLEQDRRNVRTDDHWATIRYPFLDWTGGWDANDPDPARQQTRPTVAVHGHTPALREDLRYPDQLSVCDGVDEFRAVDLDIGAGHRPQLAWAHFRMKDRQATMQLHALSAG
ncbi:MULTISPECIES: metallophosphoesterase [unclassified Yoonia]|uniref:metallophosphoesterase n=1 Tax=unclassified Yoonia TaxID=2629118 RepID=UPI002AFEEBED|nr:MULTISPECIES: metallophosphoesterase [unclassified Yoonia]